MSANTTSRARELARRILAGDRLAAARAISEVEDQSPEGDELMRLLAPALGRAWRVGVTGPPGAGKSTLVDGLAREARKRGETVGVVAVDPTSPFSGGAILGDRVRMTRALQDPEVFVRSMASRGSLGGLSRTAQEAADILDALGKSLIFLETVGVGQAELAVADAADTTLVVLVPESGGGIQAMKAGLLEIADIYVINKADRPGAGDIRIQLQEAGSLAGPWGWQRPVVETVALEGRGIPQVLDEIRRHREWLKEQGRLDEKRLEHARSRVRELVRARLEERLWVDPQIRQALDACARRVQAGELGVFAAAELFWDQIRGELAASRLDGRPSSAEQSSGRP
ncbi:MAG TPA: methylmalonyl Co-A mutase-associated GTPase MeaB [Candidatus Nitrosotenuis sp.]|nr:methylmalonyl Co-A mutase-associated GTPase MeaB [Candidatus Nitrosotenuis sp.]